MATPTLDLIITDAGRQAIVDATNTGTLPVALTQVALGSGRWSPTATATALQTEIKRIDTVGGQAVADDTIHVTITDDSADTYSLGEFGLYTDSGVLFAIYSDAVDGITGKASDALLLLAADIVLTSVSPESVTVNGTGFTNPQATETLAGIAEVATQSETDTGLDDSRMVTPKKLMGSASSSPTANYLMRRDSAGRAKIAVPVAADDIARKDTVDSTVDSHAALTAPHSATSAATASRLMLRDSAGRAKVAAPYAVDDIARKDTVDSTVDSHAALTAPHSATSTATANRLMLRDSTGRAKVAAPSAADDIARKDTVDSTVDSHAALTAPHSATSAATANRLMLRDSAGRAKAAAPSAADDIARKYEVDCAAPPGMVAHFARSTPPPGWLKANGAAVSRTTYADLFAAISTTFGAGNGSTTFNVPDLRGEFIRGWDDGRGADSGRAYGSFQSDSIKSHDHYLLNIAWSDGSPDTGVALGPKGASGPNSSAAISSSGGSETRPRNIALLACIKY